METKQESHFVEEGDVVICLPPDVIKHIKKLAAKEGDPVAEAMAGNTIRKHLQENWHEPEVRNLKDETLYWGDRPNILWGDIAAYAGYRRITTKPANAGRLARKRRRRSKLNTARVMKPIFQFGKYRVIMDIEQFIAVEHVPTRIFEIIKEWRESKNDA